MTLALAILLAAAAEQPRPTTVAVCYFDNNTGQAELAPLAKGLADMLITDLSAVPGIQIVEREKLNKALDELQLSRSKFIDPKTAQKLGRGLAARYMLSGGYTLAGSTLRIDARVFNVETGAVLASERVEGSKDEFFTLEARLVTFLARSIQVKVGPAGAKPAAGGTRSFEAWSQYSAGLDAQDKGDSARAREMFEKALRTDPAYQAARNARERLAALFAREARETVAAADRTFEGLSPGAPDFAAKVEGLLSSLSGRNSDEFTRKMKVLTWLGERNLFACPKREGPALGHAHVLVNGVPMGGVVSHCQQATDVLLIANRLTGDPSQWDVIPKVCEYFIHQLPGDKALLQYCKETLLESVDRAKEKGEKEARKEMEEELKELPPERRRARADTNSYLRAMLGLYARTPTP